MDRVPQVEYQIEWHSPQQAKVSMKKLNSDAASTRMRDVARAVVHHALKSDDGLSSVTITVRRVAKNPVRR